RRRHTRWPRDWSSDVCSSDLVAAVRRHVRPRRASVDSAGEAAASAIAADAVLDPQRTFADGRDGLQHVVSLVRRVELGRGGRSRFLVKLVASQTVKCSLASSDSCPDTAPPLAPGTAWPR